MDPQEGIRLTLIPAPDEPTSEDLEELRQKFEALPINAEESRRISVVSPPRVTFGGGPPPDEIFKYVTVAITPMATAVGIWIQARYGRSVEVEVDGIKVKARTKHEVRELLEKAQEIKQRNEPKKIHEP